MEVEKEKGRMGEADDEVSRLSDFPCFGMDPLLSDSPTTQLGLDEPSRFSVHTGYT